MRRPDYGIDSPHIIAGLLIASAIAFGAAFVFSPMRWAGSIAGAYFLIGGLGMLFYSKVGKLGVRDRLIDGIPWRGDEVVLDVGCGRGLLTCGAARRLTTGKAIGVDLWIPGAISGNRKEAVLENAALEGVSDRVELREGDARQLPFPDHSFDVVVSNFVLHEMKITEDREKMVREIARVLKPGGHAAIVDFIFTAKCVECLRKYGVEGATRSRIGSIGFWITAILSLGSTQNYLVTGTSVAAPSP